MKVLFVDLLSGSPSSTLLRTAQSFSKHINHICHCPAPSHSHSLQPSCTDRWSVPRSCRLLRTLTLILVKEKEKNEKPELQISNCITSAKPLALRLLASVGVCQSVTLLLSGSTLIALVCRWEWTWCSHSKVILNLHLIRPAGSNFSIYFLISINNNNTLWLSKWSVFSATYSGFSIILRQPVTFPANQLRKKSLG